MIALTLISAGLGAAVLTGVVRAQGVKATINDPAGPLPDPSHIPIVLPKDIKWTGQEGRNQTATLFGDQTKPDSMASSSNGIQVISPGLIPTTRSVTRMSSRDVVGLDQQRL